MIHGNAVEPGIGLDELIDLPIQMKNAGPGLLPKSISGLSNVWSIPTE